MIKVETFLSDNTPLGKEGLKWIDSSTYKEFLWTSNGWILSNSGGSNNPPLPSELVKSFGLVTTTATDAQFNYIKLVKQPDNSYIEVTTEIVVPPATTQKAGLLIADDKAKINNIPTNTIQELSSIKNSILHNSNIPTFDPDTFTLEFIANNGESLIVDLPLEHLAQNISYDSTTKSLIITKQDGSELIVPVSDLIKEYVGSIGDEIQIQIGTGNIIQAILLDGSITEDKLSIFLQNAINEATSHVLKTDNPHNVTATQLGLEKVNNTSDIDKPISTAVQTALDPLQSHIIDINNPHKTKVEVKQISNTPNFNQPVSDTSTNVSGLILTVPETGSYLIDASINVIPDNASVAGLLNVNTTSVGLIINIKRNGVSISTFEKAITRNNRIETVYVAPKVFNLTLQDTITIAVSASLPIEANLDIPSGYESTLSLRKVKLL